MVPSKQLSMFIPPEMSVLLVARTGSHSPLCHSPVPSNMPGKGRHSIHVCRRAFNWGRTSLGRDVNKRSTSKVAELETWAGITAGKYQG